MMFKTVFIRRLKDFAKDKRGYITVEAMIVIPALLWLFGAGWVYFDAFRQQSVSQKANYAIGDMISRETDAITGDYISNAQNLLLHLTKSTDADTGLRVTVVEYQDAADSWAVEWSDSRGAPDALSTADLSGYVTRLPVGAGGDQLILIETWDRYDPVIEVGLGAFDIRTYSFTRPRYAPRVLYSNG